MTNQIDKIVSRLRDDGMKTIEYFHSLQPSAWKQQVYTTGSGWNVHQILAHFVSAEESFGLLINDVAAGGEGAPRTLDIDVFNEDEVPSIAKLSSEELLTRYEDARKNTIGIVSNLNGPDLERPGYHPWFGEVELRQMLKLVYRHNMIHLRDIRRAIKNGEPVTHVDITPPTVGQL